MIIKLEADGQACLDTGSEKKASLDIVLPQHPYLHIPTTTHPALRNITHGYASSISTASGSLVGSDEVEQMSEKAVPSAPVVKDRRCRIFRPSSKRSRSQPVATPSGNTIRQDLEKSDGRRLALWTSWRNLDKRWLAVWVGISLSLCFLVAIGVWLAMRDGRSKMFVPTMMNDRPPHFINMYSYPDEFFGCSESENIYNGSRSLLPIPYGTAGEHSFTINGGASGILTLTSAPDPNTQVVTYDLLIKGGETSLKEVYLNYPAQGPPRSPSTDFVINTPQNLSSLGPASTDLGSSCLHYEITAYIPRNLRKLEVTVNTPVQVKFSPQGHVEVEELNINLTYPEDQVRIDVHESLRADNMTIELQSGLLNGGISIGNAARMINIKGDIHLEVIPNASPNLASPSPAILSTHTTSGRVSLVYLWNGAYRKRRIESYHMTESADSFGDFNYAASGFDGLVLTNSDGYNTTKATKTNGGKSMKGTNGTDFDGDEDDEEGEMEMEWTYFAGNKDGLDRLYIQSGKGRIALP